MGGWLCLTFGKKDITGGYYGNFMKFYGTGWEKEELWSNRSEVDYTTF